MNNKYAHIICLGIILIAAALLRCWDWFSIPYNHDELSAVLRTDFPNFTYFWKHGVAVDTHPPAVQIFLYYFTQWFGAEPWVVKIPFTVLGILSVWLMYLSTTIWYTKTAGLINSSLMAISQIFIIQGHTARPYVVVLFSLLLLFYFWSIWIKKVNENSENTVWIGVGIILAATLANYSHHFGMLMVVLIFIAGLFLIKRARANYLIICVIVGILYGPNVPLLLAQLERGGVGEWLGAPNLNFTYNYLAYFFNYSVSLFILFCIIVLLSFLRRKNSIENVRLLIVTSLLFFVPVLIGVVYSTFINPVIQDTMMMLFTPFLLLSINAYAREGRPMFNLFVTVSILIVGSLSLIVERDHFNHAYHNRYLEMSLLADEIYEVYGNDMEIILVNLPDYVAYNNHTYNLEYPHKVWNYRSDSLHQIHEIIVTTDKPLLFLGNLDTAPRAIKNIARHYFPYVINEHHIHGATSLLLSKNKEHAEPYLYDYYELIFPFANSSKVSIINNKGEDQGISYKSSAEEFELGFITEQIDFIEDIYDEVHVSAIVENVYNSQKLELVVEIWKNDSLALRRSRSIDQCYINNGTAFMSVGFDLNLFMENKDETFYIKSYLWNRSGEAFIIKSFRYAITEGNRNKYALSDKLK